jgi:hypothetical protein
VRRRIAAFFGRADDHSASKKKAATNRRTPKGGLLAKQVLDNRFSALIFSAARH